MGNLVKLASVTTAGNTNFDTVLDAKSTYRILYGHVTLTTDATVANRRVVLDILDDQGTPVSIFSSHAGAVVAESQTNQHHELMPGIYRETTFVGNALQVPIPQDFLIKGGYTIRISIENGVAGDSYDAYFIAEDAGHRNTRR